MERESSAIVRFEQDNLVVITGQERNVLAAIRFLDAKAQEIVVVRSKAQQSGSSYSSSLQGPAEGVEARKSAICAVGLSIGGTQSREIFRQCRNLESEDSSYDSDYENTEPVTPQDPTSGLHHDDVSRTVSDTLAAEFAEYITRGSSDSGQKLRDLATILADPSYTSRVEFALKLGYTEAQVQVALQKLGAQPSQNELLAELIKLGATVKSVGEDSQKDDLEDIISESATCESIVRTQEVIDDSANLRHIVIDGSNVAMSHGNKECFSCRGIKICVDWFRARGHSNITVFVPRWRKELSRPDAPIKDQEILTQLEKERLLVFTPSRHVGGRRMVCYDDRYILRLAADMDGIVVSNDNYRDLANENPEFKKIVEDRLLMYSFVNDRFMPPDDPLGRHGPSLDNFLRKAPKPSEPLPPPCPYGKKCTYGNKCKYYHPERGNQPQKSVTERLAEQAKIQLQEVKSRGLKSRESSPGDKLKGSQLTATSSTTKHRKQPLTRTKSLAPEGSGERLNIVERTKSEGAGAKIEMEGSVTRQEQSLYHPLVPSGFSSAGGPAGTSWPTTMPQISLVSASSPLPSPTVTSSTSSWATLSPTLPPTITGSCAEMFLEPDSGGGHLFVAKRLSDPDSHGSKSSVKSYSNIQPGHSSTTHSHSSASVSEAGSGNLHRKLQRQLTLNPAYDPRLMQLGGYSARAHRLISPQQETFGMMQRSEQSVATQRASSQENLHMMQRSFGSLSQPSHQPLSRMGSDSRVGNTLQVASQVWEGLGSPEHQTVTRIASAPDSYHQWMPPSRMHHLNSTSDTRLNLYPEVQHASHLHSSLTANYGDVHVQNHWLLQGAGMDPSMTMSPGLQIMGSAGAVPWQEQSASSALGRGTSQSISQPVRPSSVPPQGMQLGPLSTLSPARAPSPEFQDDARYKLYYHLASLFPKEQVLEAMDAYPQETNPQKICAAILSMYPKG